MRTALDRKKDRHERLEKSSSCEVGMQVACAHFAEVSQKGYLLEGSA